VWRNGGSDHRGVARFVVEKIFVGRVDLSGIRAEYVSIGLSFGAGRNLGQAIEVDAGRVVQANRWFPFCDRGYCFGQVNDRIRPQWNRAMAGNTGCRQGHTSWDLLDGLDRDVLHFPLYARSS